MRNLKKISLVTSMIGVIGLGSFAYASDFSTPADITSELTGKTVESIREEREAGKTYGQMAKDAGKQEEFKTKMIANRKAILSQKVSEGQITQEQADLVLKEIETNMENCDGTGGKEVGKKNGIGFGQGQGLGNGEGRGQKNGQKLRDGTGMGQGRGNKGITEETLIWKSDGQH